MTGRSFTVDGARVVLGESIGKGNEGEVFAVVGSPDVAIKMFDEPKARAREAKVTAMVKAGLFERTPFVAFPTTLVRDGGGRFVGFTMKRVSNHKPLFELYAPGARKAAFPNADYRFLVAAASNIARAVASVHQAGCVIGDVNHSGILISSQSATAALIDADSFQVTLEGKTFPCLVGVAEYTPPELLGTRLSEVVRTTRHDDFALAVVVFQLLFMKHPFAGKYSKGEMPMEKAIREHRFPYSVARNTGMSPPPGSSTLHDLPASIREAFEAAFGPALDRRPTAKSWIQLLDEMRDSLRPCGGNAKHFYSSAAPNCPWCRTESATGTMLFLPPELVFDASTVPPFDPSEAGFNIKAVWAAIEAIRQPSLPPMPQPPKQSLKPSVEAREAVSRRARRRVGGAVFAVVGAALAIGMPGMWALWVAAVLTGLVMMFSQIKADDSFAQRYVTACLSVQKTFQAWRTWTGANQFDLLRTELSAARAKFEALGSEYRRRWTEYEQNRAELQRQAFMSGFLIRKYQISGIGPARLQLLASYGIETAADASEARVLQVPGFGPVNSRPLFEWRKRCERQFAFTPQRTAGDAAAQRRIKDELDREARDLRKTLAEGPGRLSALAGQIAARATQVNHELLREEAKKLQAETDLKYLGLALPPIPTVAVSSPPSSGASAMPSGRSFFAQPSAGVTAVQPATARAPAMPTATSATATPSCPRCGRVMRRRVARRGSRAGRYFWGCSRYPSCRGTRPI